MKHLFHIHSYTCYLVSLGIIDIEKIEIENVVFLICRNLPAIRKDIKHIYIDDETYYYPYLTNRQLFTFKFLHVKSVIRTIDDIIEHEISEEYIYYVHNSRNYLYRVIITNKYCENVNFIEDGLDMYFDKNAYEIKYPYKVRRRHKIINYLLGHSFGRNVYKRIRQVNDPFANKGGEKVFYGLTNKAFSKIINNQSKYIKVNTEILKKIQSYQIERNSNVFVFSALVEQNVLKQEEVKKFLVWFVGKFKIQNLYINFHPHQGENTRHDIIRLLKKISVNVKVIPDNVIMELFFLNNDDINVYGVGTSLLVYAVYFSKSSEVIALYPFFKNHLKLNTIRTKFWENTFENLMEDNFKLYQRDIL